MICLVLLGNEKLRIWPIDQHIGFMVYQRRTDFICQAKDGRVAQRESTTLTS